MKTNRLVIDVKIPITNDHILEIFDNKIPDIPRDELVQLIRREIMKGRAIKNPTKEGWDIDIAHLKNFKNDLLSKLK